MNSEDAGTREKILTATTRLLMESNAKPVTTRQIAEAAGVNVAAINYHFKSKDAVIEEAVLHFSQIAFSAGMKILERSPGTAEERLGNFLKGYAKGLVGFYGLTNQAFLDLLTSTATRGRYAEMTGNMLRAMANVLREATGAAAEGADDGIDRRALALFSGVVLPFMLQGFLSGLKVIDYADPSARDSYIELLVRMATGKED